MLRLVSWNVNGIRSIMRKGTFGPMVEHLAPDVFCLQETKAQEAHPDYEVEGYEQHWYPAVKKGYSGTAIFSKTAPRTVATGFPEKLITKFQVEGDVFGDPNAEGRVLTAEFDQFFLITVYTPNSKDDLGRLGLRHAHWDPAFLAYAKSLEKKKPVVFCGDLNVAHTPDDLANPKPNAGKKGFTNEEREGFQNYLDAGFVDTFRMFHEGNGHYSYWSHFANARARNVGWRIDYFLVSAALRSKVVAADIHADIMGSDHCPISLTLDL